MKPQNSSINFQNFGAPKIHKRFSRIALLGGSFNPIHKEHIKIIKEVLDKKLVDEVWIIPCKKHPFNKSLLDEKHRVEMIKLAIKNMKKVRICKIELETKGISYTINTIRKLKRKYSHQFFMIIGSDILHEIKKWHKYKQILKEIEFITFIRKGYSFKKVPGMKIVYLINKKLENISSTEIRERIEEGKSFKSSVPLSVRRYIKKERLYK